jgi:Rhodopirellula transposase DDE domain
LEHDTAGDPITGLKWTHRTPEKIAQVLSQLGFPISANTVARLLHRMNYTLRVNHKELASTSSPDRDQQFEYISALRTRFARQRLPMISVDTKKRELVGNFKNPGASDYPTDTAPAKDDIRQLRLNPHDTLPSWNYTITPNL